MKPWKNGYTEFVPSKTDIIVLGLFYLLFLVFLIVTW